MNNRLEKHIARHRGFTGHKSDWGIAYMETYQTKKEAMEREREIKA